ncbi:hypothetical protein [Brachyspira catarrhinii]|uniref:CopG family transcriptional regulator n=1 Tax=Brachyspira catarrhinii TaxID=2528966 RepID=A0ABY2TM13_9SPIR|nr:hypothetical protein [Brachyspira catarrhinii]TKZ23986.1 hypothetical protein EZH24_12845 [Brachyspira catarrhinii]
MKNEEFAIKEEYDFSDGENIREFENGKYFLRMEEMEIPIYLNRKVLDNLEKLSEKENISISQLINKMIKYYSNSKRSKKSAVRQE